MGFNSGFKGLNTTNAQTI